MKKRIKQIVNNRDVMMGDIRIGQPMPQHGLQQISPFILLHHGAPKEFKGGREAIHVPPHPHRGFEPISFIFQGEIQHKDSFGTVNTIRDGGVQWMTAGRGMVHSESSSPEFNEKGGIFEMIQLWVNLPGKLKMVQPNYQGFQREDIPFFEGDRARVNVISGEMGGVKGPVKSITNITALTVEMEKGGSVKLNFPEERNILLYLLHGKTKINGTGLSDQQLIEFEDGGTEVEIAADDKSLLLIVAGEPIDEPMAQHGPFVMNTQTEILEAMRDYQMGKMGVL